MYQQVPDRHLPSHPGIVHLEAGKTVDHPVVPGDLPCIDECGERRHGEGLSGGSRREYRVGVHPCRLTELARTVAAHERRLAILHDRD